jgi:hypothetical protein
VRRISSASSTPATTWVTSVVEVVGAAVVVVTIVVVVVSIAVGTVVGEGSEFSRGHRAQIPTAKPTTIRPASNRRITARSNLRKPHPKVKGLAVRPRKVPVPDLYGWRWR